MAGKESCITHPANDEFLIIRRHYVDMFCGNVHLAALVSLFEYFTNGELAQFAKRREAGIPWVQVEMPVIESWMMGICRRRVIQDCLGILDQAGILRSATPGGRAAKSYLLNIDGLNRMIADGVKLPLEMIGKNADQTFGDDRQICRSNDALIGINGAVSADQSPRIKSIGSLRIEEEKKEAESPLPSSEKTPPEPDQLDLEDDAVTFVQHAYSRENRRAKLDNLRSRKSESLCEKIRRADTEYGPEGFRSALLIFLADQSAWLQEHHWPIAAFLKQVDHYLPEVAQNPQGAAKAPRPARAAAGEVSQDPPIQPAASNSGQAGIEARSEPAPPQIPFAAQEWNRVVTAGPAVEQWTKYDQKLAVDDPDFLAALPKVLAICQKGFEAQGGEVEWLNFRYLLRNGKGTEVPNWYRMASGEFNWLKKKRGGQTRLDKVNSAIDNVLASLGG